MDMAIEYSQGMEEFPEEGAREPRRLEPSKETIDEWGGTPQPGFGQVGKLFTDDEKVKSIRKIFNLFQVEKVIAIYSHLNTVYCLFNMNK